MSLVLIRGGHCIHPAEGSSAGADILIQEGKILEVGTLQPPKEAQIIEASGLVVLPGLIDLQAHLREPGREDQETIASGLAAAVRGGFTAVAAMPDTDPPMDHSGVVEQVLAAADALESARIYPVGAATLRRSGETLTDFGELYDAGCIAWGDGNRCVVHALLMRRALEYSRVFNRPIFQFAEDPLLAAGGVVNEGSVSAQLGLKGTPSTAESVIIARDLQIAEMTEGWVHFTKISSERSVSLIREAKQRGVRVTCGVAAHHLLFTDDCVKTFNTSAKVRPPFRAESSRKALIEGLLDDTIDCIVSDHSPVTPWEKEADYDNAPAGESALETALSVSIKALLEGPGLDWPLLAKKWSWAPALIAGMQGGRLEPGAPADITLVDAGASWNVDAQRFVSRGKHSLLQGETLPGRVHSVFVEGRRVYSGSETVEEG